ncbi:MAG: hypothetical protein ACXABK_06410, partial [Candidatus Heimdallarchaeaceae archaeon]
RGVHFALDLEIQQGDSSEIVTKEGSWSIHIKVNRDEKTIGEIVKIITPLELSNGGKIRYIDLGLMLVKKNEEVEVIDQGIIDDLAEKEIISTEFKEKVSNLFDLCQKKLAQNEDMIIILSD